jgi:hypothetical protein
MSRLAVALLNWRPFFVNLVNLRAGQPVKSWNSLKKLN